MNRFYGVVSGPYGIHQMIRIYKLQQQYILADICVCIPGSLITLTDVQRKYTKGGGRSIEEGAEIMTIN